MHVCLSVGKQAGTYMHACVGARVQAVHWLERKRACIYAHTRLQACMHMICVCTYGNTDYAFTQARVYSRIWFSWDRLVHLDAMDGTALSLM